MLHAGEVLLEDRQQRGVGPAGEHLGDEGPAGLEVAVRYVPMIFMPSAESIVTFAAVTVGPALVFVLLFVVLLEELLTATPPQADMKRTNAIAYFI